MKLNLNAMHFPKEDKLNGKDNDKWQWMLKLQVKENQLLEITIGIGMA